MDESALISALGEVKESVAQVNGKVDTALALLTRVSDRQDNIEARVDRVERDFDNRMRILQVTFERKADLTRDRIDDAYERAMSALKESNSDHKGSFETAEKDRYRIDKKHDESIKAINWRIAMGAGVIAAAMFVAPLVLKIFLGI